MNNRGNIMLLGIKLMLGITLIILILSIAPVIKQNNDTTMNPNNMDCENSSISDTQRLGCISTDLSLFLFVGGILITAIGIFTLRRLNII